MKVFGHPKRSIGIFEALMDAMQNFRPSCTASSMHYFHPGA
jgi:hypothetical protein